MVEAASPSDVMCYVGGGKGADENLDLDPFNSKYYVVHRTLRLAATARLRSII